ncbi:roadblock/LC7 domain-containing protein, partial [Streptomyces sp. NPDC004031]
MLELTRTDRPPTPTSAAHRTRSAKLSPMSQAAQNLNWLITNFVDNTPGVSHTVVVSAD